MTDRTLLKSKLERLVPNLCSIAREIAQVREEELNDLHYYSAAERLAKQGKVVRLDVRYSDLVRHARKMVFGVGFGEITHNPAGKTTSLFYLDELPKDNRDISIRVIALPDLYEVCKLNSR